MRVSFTVSDLPVFSELVSLVGVDVAGLWVFVCLVITVTP